MKLPAFQFYPGDWLKDNVSGCSLAAQGLWLRMLLLAHESDRRGYLIINGKPMQPEFLARKCGCDDTAQFLTLFNELSDAGVPSQQPDGTIYSRRMVRDEQKRRKCSDAGKAGGGNPKLSTGTFKGDSKGVAKGDLKGDSKRFSKASTSSSSSSSNEDKEKENNINIISKKEIFSPPKFDEVFDYLVSYISVEKQDFNFRLEAQKFVNFYESKGWFVGKNKMKDWRAAARNWAGNHRTSNTTREKSLREIYDAI